MLSILLGTITMAAALRLAVPLILSSIGGCFGDRTGIFNIALESFMLCAAFFATLGTYYSGNPYTGVFCGILAGLACSVLFGILVFHLGSSGMVVSIAMNLGMDAFTSFLLLNIFGKRGSFMDRCQPALCETLSWHILYREVWNPQLVSILPFGYCRT
ncbi:MAG: ABC transporter permease subunit [Enterocloster aldenensis]